MLQDVRNYAAVVAAAAAGAGGAGDSRWTYVERRAGEVVDEFFCKRDGHGQVIR